MASSTQATVRHADSQSVAVLSVTARDASDQRLISTAVCGTCWMGKGLPHPEVCSEPRVRDARVHVSASRAVRRASRQHQAVLQGPGSTPATFCCLQQVSKPCYLLLRLLPIDSWGGGGMEGALSGVVGSALGFSRGRAA